MISLSAPIPDLQFGATYGYEISLRPRSQCANHHRIGGRSIGIFHHDGEWYAVRNYCLHRSGPVATGSLEGDVLTCPWHGYQYDVKTGEFLLDPAVKLETYQVEIRDGKVHVQLPTVVMDSDMAEEASIE